MLDEQQLRTLYEFSSGARDWGEWPRWLAVHAASMARQLERDQLKRLKEDPAAEIPRLLSGRTFEVTSKRPKLAHDPIEDDPAIRQVILAAKAQAEQQLSRPAASQMGDCHLLWQAMKRILKEQHGIHWRSPAEMNPDVIFD